MVDRGRSATQELREVLFDSRNFRPRRLAALRRRRRIARAEMAIHVLRGHSVIYRVSFRGPVSIVASHRLLMAFCHVDGDYGPETDSGSSL